MPMMWMRMPGQTWPGAAASFVGAWIVMMVPMMLPAVAPALWRYGMGVRGAGSARRAFQVALVVSGYLIVWTVIGAAVFPLGVALATIVASQPVLTRAAPLGVGLVVLLAGAWQLTTWKARQLACCRQANATRIQPMPTIGSAWRHGVRLGVECARCCANLMVILLVVGMTDVRVMVVVGAAIVLERFAPEQALWRILRSSANARRHKAGVCRARLPTDRCSVGGRDPRAGARGREE